MPDPGEKQGGGSGRAKGPERRNHFRFSAMAAVTLTARGQEAQEGYMAGISRGGLGLYLQRPVAPGQLVVVNLPLIERGTGNRVLKIAARIRWVRPAGALFMAGLTFEKMSDERFRALMGHLHIMERLQL